MPRDATDDDVRRAYQRLAREHHPDREGGADDAFLGVQRAWEALRDPAARREYDQRLRAKESATSQTGVLASEVEFDEMEFAPDDEGGPMWLYDCRCGDVYEVRLSELRAGVNTWQCCSCSLAIRPVGAPPDVGARDEAAVAASASSDAVQSGAAAAGPSSSAGAAASAAAPSEQEAPTDEARWRSRSGR